jgi:tetratricopeptide (TPR) repeat protein
LRFLTGRAADHGNAPPRPGIFRMGIAVRALIIATAASWSFWPALHGGWLWDDSLEVANNPLVRDTGGWWKPWVAPSGMDYFPLKSTLQWVQWRLWGADVTGYHLANLALHVCSALLLWRLLWKLGARLPWLGGLLFAVHPMAVESVAWISEFKNAVSLPPLLLAMSAYVSSCEGRVALRGSLPANEGGFPLGSCIGAAPSLRFYFFALFWFAVAMLCKASVVMFPVVLLVFSWWRRRGIGKAELRAIAPFFAVSLALGLVTLGFQWSRAMGLSRVPGGWGARWGQAGWCVLAYLRSCVFPVGLAPVYAPFRTALPAVLPWAAIAATLALFWTRRSDWGRHALFGSGWFLLNLLPVIGLIPMAYLRVSPRADHLAYLSLAGVTAVVAAGFGAIWERARMDRLVLRAALASLAVAAVAALAAGTRAYAAAFRDEETLWSVAVAREPEAWLARSNLGRILLNEGHVESALAELAAAARLEPASGEVRANLGNALERSGRAADALAQYREAVALEPRFAGGHYDLGRALLQSGRMEDAAAEFRTALHLNPDYAAAHNNLGLAVARLGRWMEAMDEYRAALRLNPGMPEAHLNLGNACFKLNRPAEAVDEYRAALRQDPHYAAAHRNLAAVLRALGRESEARSEFEAAAASGAP